MHSQLADAASPKQIRAGQDFAARTWLSRTMQGLAARAGQYSAVLSQQNCHGAPNRTRHVSPLPLRIPGAIGSLLPRPAETGLTVPRRDWTYQCCLYQPCPALTRRTFAAMGLLSMTRPCWTWHIIAALALPCSAGPALPSQCCRDLPLLDQPHHAIHCCRN
jgi:hypothetical protein